MSRLVWIEPEPVPPDLEPLHPDPLIHELLYRRGIRDQARAEEFLQTQTSVLPETIDLPNLIEAVERASHAVDAGETIAVYGDYDADGVTSTAVLVRALRAATRDPARVLYRLPTRDEGYGLNAKAIDAFAEAGSTLLITVDCGSTDHDNVTYARNLGLDVIVFDHHHMHDEGPESAIIVSAQLAKPGKYRELAAVGVAYLFVVALVRKRREINGKTGDPRVKLLDLVALGTIADVSPMLGENRALVRDGIEQIRTEPRAGVAALCRKGGVDPRRLTSDQISFRIAPRLNAAGRMGDPKQALELLLTDDVLEAENIATAIETLDTGRRDTSARITEEADLLVRSDENWATRPLLVVRREGWNAGVLGAVANQLVNRFGRPTVILADDGTVSRGSARSVPGFDVAAALTRCADLLLTYGGHSQAAGLSLPSSKVPELETRLTQAIEEAGLGVSPEPTLEIDAEIDPSRLDMKTAEVLDLLQPFGQGNRAPQLLVRNLTVAKWDAIGQDKTHLRVTFTTPKGNCPAVFWGAAARSREFLTNRTVDLVGVLSVDHWNGNRKLQVEIKDFRAVEDRI